MIFLVLVSTSFLALPVPLTLLIFLNIALKALDAHEGAEALKYANKALEINSVSSEAWVVKMKSMTYLATFTDPKVNETTEYGKNAITYAPVDKKPPL